MSGWLLILALLLLGGVLSTLGDRLGSKVGKARLSLLGELRNAGLVQIDRKKITVFDPLALAKRFS